MSTALSSIMHVRDPHLCTIWFIQIMRRLTELGVTLTYGTVEAGDLGHWDSVTREVCIRPDATLPAQVWLLERLYTRLVIGAWADPVGIAEPILRLVPNPVD